MGPCSEVNGNQGTRNGQVGSTLLMRMTAAPAVAGDCSRDCRLTAVLSPSGSPARGHRLDAVGAVFLSNTSGDSLSGTNIFSPLPNRRIPPTPRA